MHFPALLQSSQLWLCSRRQYFQWQLATYHVQLSYHNMLHTVRHLPTLVWGIVIYYINGYHTHTALYGTSNTHQQRYQWTFWYIKNIIPCNDTNFLDPIKSMNAKLVCIFTVESRKGFPVMYNSSSVKFKKRNKLSTFLKPFACFQKDNS